MDDLSVVCKPSAHDDSCLVTEGCVYRSYSVQNSLVKERGIYITGNKKKRKTLETVICIKKIICMQI